MLIEVAKVHVRVGSTRICDRVEEQVLDHALHAMSRRGDAIPVLVDAVDDPGKVEAQQVALIIRSRG